MIPFSFSSAFCDFLYYAPHPMHIRLLLRTVLAASLLTSLAAAQEQASSGPHTPAPATAQSRKSKIENPKSRWFHPRRYLDPYWTLADRVRQAEIVEMLAALAQGSPPAPGKGWFHEGESRYGWQWLTQRYDQDDDQTISPNELPSEAAELFARLDRDEDGLLKADDFDWSESAPFVKQSAQARRFFGPLDDDHNGRLTREEWQDFFERAALGGEAITPDDLRAALFPPEPAKDDDDPTPLGLLKGFVTGELGSVYEGPALEQRAPDFELADNHGRRRIRLSELYGKKPVVLIFGSFT